jgi:O-antigen/teichoic acid export membrane protein
MSRLEESILRRWPGQRILLVSAAAGFAGVAPLLLYIAFGPPDGNPIGLGLLAVATVPFSLAGIAVGIMVMVVRRLRKGA